MHSLVTLIFPWAGRPDRHWLDYMGLVSNDKSYNAARRPGVYQLFIDRRPAVTVFIARRPFLTYSSN